MTTRVYRMRPTRAECRRMLDLSARLIVQCVRQGRYPATELIERTDAPGKLALSMLMDGGCWMRMEAK